MSDQNNGKDTEKKPSLWANPTPAGLVALAVAAFIFFAFLTGRLTKEALPLMACFFFGGFVIQFIVALCDLKGGNHAGGNTFLYFSAYFMLVTGVELLFKYYMPNPDTTVDGWAWTVLALTCILWTPAFFKGSSLLFIIVCFLDIALPFVALNDFKFAGAAASSVFSNIAGYSLLFSGIIAIYLAAAIVVNTAYNKTIFPNPKSFYEMWQANKAKKLASDNKPGDLK